MTFSVNPTAEKTHAQFQSAAIAQNGTGALAPIQGGAPGAAPPAAGAPPPPPAPPADAAPPAPPAGASTELVAGSGAPLPNGQCSCSCFCGVSSFPTAAQGIGAVGGMGGTSSPRLQSIFTNTSPGSMPMGALMRA